MKSAGIKIVNNAFSGLVKAKDQLHKGRLIIAQDRKQIEVQQNELIEKDAELKRYAESASEGINNINAVLPKGLK